MNGESKRSTWGIGIGLGLSALAGLLISAIIGMLHLVGKPREQTASPSRTADSSDMPARQMPAEQAADQRMQRTPAPSPPDAGAAPVKSKTTWKQGTKYFAAAILVFVFAWLLYISRNAISTIIFAILLTFIVHPLTLFTQRKLKMRYGTATALTYLLVLLLIILLPLLLIPSIVEAFGFLGQVDFTATLAHASNWLMQQAAALASIPVIGASLSATMNELANMLNGTSAPPVNAVPIDYTQIGGRIAQTVQFLVNIFGPLISLATSVVFALLISLHINLSLEMINKSTRSLIPDPYEEEIMALIYRLLRIWKAFLRGQLVLMVVVGLMVWIGNAILGTPQALFLGLTAGVLEVIPNLGPILATVPAVILALLFGSQTAFLGLSQLDPWVFALIVIGLYILIQVTENQLLVPYILGDAVDLPPMVVLGGVLVGGSAFGLWGVLLATPMISSGREIFNYMYNKILEEPPTPPPPEKKPSIIATLRKYARRIPLPRAVRDLGKAQPQPAEDSNEHADGQAA